MVYDVSDTDNDWIGIASTRLNAELVRAIFAEKAHDRVYGNPKEKIETGKNIIIGAGWLPGHSSDVDAVELAGTFGAGSLINMSNIDRVYDSDPRQNTAARPIDSITWDDFLNITGDEWCPGRHVPFDPVASIRSKELGLKVIILKGTDLENFAKCLDGEEFAGTTIQ
jgi:uridylate kinase